MIVTKGLSNSNLTLNGMFEIDFVDVPELNQVLTETFPLDSSPLMFECIQNSDCNNGQSGPNRCLKIRNFKNFNLNSTTDIESLLRNFEFITNKDAYSLIKYNQLLNQSSEFVMQLKSNYNTTYEYLLNGGVCVCDENYSGYRCENLLLNDKPNFCHINSTIQSCNSGVCKLGNFKLRNIQNKVSMYKSYKCECDQNKIGLNCEYRTNKCSLNTNSTFIQSDTEFLCTNSSQFCYPLTNDNFNCMNENTQLNYLIFDDTNFPSGDDYRLDVSKSEVLNQIQDFIKNNALNSFVTNDYPKIPKGPLAVLMQPIDTVFSSIKNKFNQLINNSESKYLLDADLNRLINNQVRFLISEIETNDTNIDFIISKLQLFEKKNYSDYQAIPANIQLTTSLNASLIQLDSKLNNSNLSGLFIYKLNNQFYLNVTNKTYNIIRLDILSGIYIDTNEQLIIRPTPGLFLTSISNNTDLIFLPGVFNLSYSSDCSNLNCVFTPGIMSLPVDTYDLDSYNDESTKYLNRFSPLVLPFNINGILVPFKSLNVSYLESVNTTTSSKLILTPLDFNQNINFDFIKRNSSFIADILSTESFTKLVRSINQTNSMLTQASDRTQVNSNLRLASDATNLKPKGIQFYNLIQPRSDIKALPFMVYESNEINTISNDMVQKSIVNYCSNYKNEMNELHSRLCEAQKVASALLNLFKKDSDYCSNQADCSFRNYILDFYSNNSSGNSANNLVIIKKNDASGFIAVLVLAAVLSKVLFSELT